MGILIVFELITVYDLIQKKHAILHNFPLIGHLRYADETIRPEMQPYFIERNFDGAPFDCDTRRVVYERAKGIASKKSFGTELEIPKLGYEYVCHSMAPNPNVVKDPRVMIGGPDCKQPYSASIMNISAMSFGSLSPNAVMAMNKGAKMGNFVQDTGEGAISPYHLKYGADIYWQLGSGYLGARTADGDFNPELFAEKAKLPQVKATYLKVSQGAKPGLGSMLPGGKVNQEIAETCHVPVGGPIERLVARPNHKKGPCLPC